MSVCSQSYWTSAWLWLVIFGVLFIIAGAIVLFMFTTVVWYGWGLVILGIILVIIGGFWGYSRSASCAKSVAMSKPPVFLSPMSQGGVYPTTVPVTGTVTLNPFPISGNCSGMGKPL